MLGKILVALAASSVAFGQAAQVFSSCVNPNSVALTFDDGPYIYSHDIVDLLNANNATGTFFYNGDNYACIYDNDSMERIKYAYSHGHMIGSHTWHHYDLATLSWDQIHDEMWRVEEALTRIIGAYPAFMRPPFGSFNDLVQQASGVRGQSIAIWDFDSEDSIGASVATSEGLYDRELSKHPKNLLPLNHETLEGTAHQVLPYVIQKLKAAGYDLVSLATCLNMPAYQWTTTPGTPDSSWQC